MQNRLNIIENAPLFNGLPTEHLEELRQITVEKEYGRGDTIFMDGDAGNGFYVVLAGKVKVAKVSAEGKEQILHIFGPGEPFGEVPVFTGKPFPANAQAISKSVLAFFPKKRFIALIKANPSLALNMLAVLSTRLRQFTIQVENLSLKEVPERLASYLLFLAREQENPTEVTLPISKGQLASLLGTIPETLSRIFSKMSSDDLIKVEGKKITLCNPAELEALSIHGKG
ncbi:MAG: Crp/Fnr family transcriptional regulator [Desulfobacterales bacterium]|nr:Crp/Fnr family transcriptional regulator [Desulfobacterales bacterium]